MGTRPKGMTSSLASTNTWKGLPFFHAILLAFEQYLCGNEIESANPEIRRCLDFANLNKFALDSLKQAPRVDSWSMQRTSKGHQRRSDSLGPNPTLRHSLPAGLPSPQCLCCTFFGRGSLNGSPVKSSMYSDPSVLSAAGLLGLMACT